MALPVMVLRNGELVEPAQAHVSVFNPALSGAFGVYESLQVVRGVIFARRAHLERLQQSAAMLDLPLPAGGERLAQWMDHILDANQARDAVLRVLAVGPANGGETILFLWPQDPQVYPGALYAGGAPAITYEGRRALPQAKSLDTLVCYLARRQALRMGANEGLLYHNEHLTEGSNSNLFAVMGNRLITAPDKLVLSGVSRDILLKLALQDGIPVDESAPPVADIPRWQECFITSTSRHVMPITTIDGKPIGDGKVGPVTRRLMQLFEAYFARALSVSAAESPLDGRIHTGEPRLVVRRLSFEPRL